MALPPDIIGRVNRDFIDPATAAQSIGRLETAHAEAPDVFTDRILRCAVYVAKGDLDTLDRALDLGRVDYRDLIVWAEYDNNFETRRRDLTKPFS